MSVARSALVLSVAVSSLSWPSAQVATVLPAAETEPVPDSGDAADDAAIWVHPAFPGKSLIIGTDKHGGLAVYDLAGKQLQFLPDGDLNNVDLRYGFPLGGIPRAIVTSGERQRNRLAVYAVDPNQRLLVDVAARDILFAFDVYGCCMYRSASTGDTYFVGTSKTGELQQWRLFEVSGKVDAELVRSFDVGGTCEGCVADDEEAALYVAEESVGIWRYGAEPGAGTARVLVDSTGSGGGLTADVEGLAIYYAPAGDGYLIASSQGSSTFVVYERRSPYTRLLTFQVGSNPVLGIDAVTGTDGIEVTNLWLGSSYSGGLLVVQDDDNPGANQNFKLVRWEDVAALAPGLVVTPSYDALGARCPAPRATYRNGSGTNTIPLTSLTPPRLGFDWESELDCSSSGSAGAFLSGYALPASGVFLGAGELLVDPRSGLLFRLAHADPTWPARFRLSIPPDLLLCGFEASVQGLCLGGSGPRLSNAVDLELGW